MKMISWRTGFFRLWCAVALLWVIFIVSISAEGFITPYVAPKSLSAIDPVDKKTGLYKESGPWSFYQKQNGEAKIMEIDGLIGWEIYVPTNVSDENLDKIANAAHKQITEYIAERQKASRYSVLRSISLAAILPPLCLLMFGVIVSWVIRGFSVRNITH